MANLTKGEYTGIVVLLTAFASAFLAGLLAGPSGVPAYEASVGLFMLASLTYLGYRGARRAGGVAYEKVA